jgi:hypothetical protein
VSAAVDSCAYLWHRRGEVLAVHRLLGNAGGLLLEVKVDEQRLEVDVPESEVGALTRALVEHCRRYGLETGDGYVDAYGIGVET